MAYDEKLALRIQNAFQAKKLKAIEKKMFGGVAYMYKSKMACGIIKDELMVRVIDSKYEASLQKPFCSEMKFTGRIMKGFLIIEPDGFKTDRALHAWLDLGIEFVDNQKPAKTKFKKKRLNKK